MVLRIFTIQINHTDQPNDYGRTGKSVFVISSIKVIAVKALSPSVVDSLDPLTCRDCMGKMSIFTKIPLSYIIELKKIPLVRPCIDFYMIF